MSLSPLQSPDSEVLSDSDEELVQQLEKEATDHWGDKWAISIRRWADGTAQIRAEHIRGLTPDGNREKERLVPAGDGELVHEVITVTKPETVSHEVLEQPDSLEEK